MEPFLALTHLPFRRWDRKRRWLSAGGDQRTPVTQPNNPRAQPSSSPPLPTNEWTAHREWWTHTSSHYLPKPGTDSALIRAVALKDTGCILARASLDKYSWRPLIPHLLLRLSAPSNISCYRELMSNLWAFHFSAQRGGLSRCAPTSGGVQGSNDGLLSHHSVAALCFLLFRFQPWLYGYWKRQFGKKKKKATWINAFIRALLLISTLLRMCSSPVGFVLYLGSHTELNALFFLFLYSKCWMITKCRRRIAASKR